MTLSEELKNAEKYKRDLNGKIMEAMRIATEKAIQAAADATPPLSEPNTTTGELKAHWETDSNTKAEHEGNVWRTYLANNVQYASYVNDGHRMDRHFVPGLVKTDFGLEYFPQLRGQTGIMVGTKTKYVPGLHMTDKGQDAFYDNIGTVLAGLLEEGL